MFERGQQRQAPRHGRGAPDAASDTLVERSSPDALLRFRIPESLKSPRLGDSLIPLELPMDLGHEKL